MKSERCKIVNAILRLGALALLFSLLISVSVPARSKTDSDSKISDKMVLSDPNGQYAAHVFGNVFYLCFLGGMGTKA